MMMRYKYTKKRNLRRAALMLLMPQQQQDIECKIYHSRLKGINQKNQILTLGL